MRKVLSIFVALELFSSCVFAQIPSTSLYNGVLPAILNTIGGSYDNAGDYYRYEWSTGELLLIQTFSSPDSSVVVTQGVLQPCTDKIGLSAFTVLFEAGDYKLFPNPTGGRFEVDFFVSTPGQMSLQLINSTGQMLEKRSYHYDGCCRIELFDLGRYPDGVYYVVADLKPDSPRSDGITVIRHSGLKVIKLNSN